jgi:Uma2 family endonuclease
MPAIDTKHLTFADYLLSPMTMQRQLIITNVYRPLNAYLQENHRGMVIFAPCDIVIRRDPLRTRQPDLFIFLQGRDDVGDLENLLDQPAIEVAPDITVEIISKNETRRARAAKIEDYRHIGVKECWIVSPQALTVEVLRLSPGGMRTVGIYGVGMRVQSEILEGLDLAVDDIFV